MDISFQIIYMDLDKKQWCRIRSDKPFPNLTKSGTYYDLRSKAIMDAMKVQALSFDPAQPRLFSIENIIYFNRNGLFDNERGVKWDLRKKANT